MTRTPTITIGIPAYNEESNIGRLLRDIFSQSYKKYQLKKVIISLDGSTDNTAGMVRRYKSSIIKLINNPSRRGKARGLNQIINQCDSDILIIFDADISLVDDDTIENMSDMITSGKCDLTSAATRPILSGTYINRVLNHSVKMKSFLYANFHHGSNIYNCVGMAMGMSRKLYKSLNFPPTAGDDIYAYMACKDMGYRFSWAGKSLVNFNSPANIGDYVKQSTRFNVSKKSRSLYPDTGKVNNEFHIPLSVYLRSFPSVFILAVTHPVLTLTYLILVTYTQFKSMNVDSMNDMWSMSESTKRFV